MKDIPPRFKKLFEAAAVQKSAASKQLEGLPLVRQPGPLGAVCADVPPSEDSKTNRFNPNAQCFIPGQPYDSPSAEAKTLKQCHTCLQ